LAQFLGQNNLIFTTLGEIWEKNGGTTLNGLNVNINSNYIGLTHWQT